MGYRWRSKHPSQRDTLEPVIIRELQDRGALVIELDFPLDLLVGYLGHWFLAEVKSSEKAPFRLTQIKFLDQCKLRGLKAVVLDDLDCVDEFFPIPPDGV